MGREPRSLKNPPLVEAIFEVRWALAPAPGLPWASLPGGPPVLFDPHYQLLLGRVFDRVRNEYPNPEALQMAFLGPMLVQTVQHRFRHRDAWPCVQLGPGILTVNDTKKYGWDDFRPRCVQAVNTLFEVHPKPDELKIENLVLRFINAVDFDHTAEDVGAFLREEMGLGCSLPGSLFDENPVQPAPVHFKWNTAYRCDEPLGQITLVFATGTRDKKNALVWEIIFQTAGKDIPPLPAGYDPWADAAHEVIEDWFFKLIAGGNGELLRRFKGDDG